jgi:hypothetical protein
MYKLQLLQQIKEEDKVLCFDVAIFVLDRLAEGIDYLKGFVFTDEATFHTSGVVNRHNCCI